MNESVRLSVCHTRESPVAYLGFQLRGGREFFIQFKDQLFSHQIFGDLLYSPLSSTTCKGAPVAKASMVLSKHHRRPLVRMFQTFATCV